LGCGAPRPPSIPAGGEGDILDIGPTVVADARDRGDRLTPLGRAVLELRHAAMEHLLLRLPQYERAGSGSRSRARC
jgi:hypothetical protein